MTSVRPTPIASKKNKTKTTGATINKHLSQLFGAAPRLLLWLPLLLQARVPSVFGSVCYSSYLINHQQANKKTKLD